MRAGLQHLVEPLNSPEARLQKTQLSHIVYGLTLTPKRCDARSRTAPAPRDRTGADHATDRHRRHQPNRRNSLESPVIARQPLLGIDALWVDGASATRWGVFHRGRHSRGSPPTLCRRTVGRNQCGRYARRGPPYRFDEPKVELWILWLTFSTRTFSAAYHVPNYGRWPAETKPRNAYAHHQRVMQHFNRQRRKQEPRGHRHRLLMFRDGGRGRQ